MEANTDFCVFTSIMRIYIYILQCVHVFIYTLEVYISDYIYDTYWLHYLQ